MFALTLASLLLPAISYYAQPAAASACVAMDTSFNLLVFGVGGKDYNASTQASWTSGTATDITTTGRPPFDGTNTTCYLAQFFNAIYAVNADASDPLAVYIFDATAKSWSKQAVTNTGTDKTLDATNYKAVLDHDTNVFYALSAGEMFFLDMSSETTANSSALAWVDVGTPTAWGDLSSYQPTMALAQNHIHFIGVPNLAPGSADIFVIHFSFFQPDAQSYSSDFPETHGQTASFFQATTASVQQEFAFIPDSGSATYVINVESNSTQTLAAPSVKDASAQYFAGVTSLVQLSTSQKSLSFLPYQEGQDNSAAQWTSITAVPLSALGTTSGNGTTAGAAAGGSSSATGSGSGSSTTGTSSASAANSLTRGAGKLSVYGAPVAGALALATLLLG